MTQVIVRARNPWRHYRTGLFGVGRPLRLLSTMSSFLPFTCDAPYKWQLTFQTPNTTVMEKIIDLHHDITFLLIVIVFFVGWILATTISFYSDTDLRKVRVVFSHNVLLERV